jgi:uncharacterized protein with NRDE domain
VVPDWLAARERADRFWMRTALTGYNPFTLVAADFAAGECFSASNDGSLPQRLERGLYGLSGAGLDTPSPKVDALKARLRDALGADSADELCRRLFAALADRTPADDAALPATGAAREFERTLSAAFVRTPDGRYGTRCTTLVVAERVGRTVITHVVERSFASDGTAALQRHAALRHWPPRQGDGVAAAEVGAITEGAASDTLPSGATRRRRETLAAA